MKKIIILNGPNLNLLGEREKSQYGSFTLKDIEKTCKQYAKENNLDIFFFQFPFFSFSSVLSFFQQTFFFFFEARPFSFSCTLVLTIWIEGRENKQ